MIRIAACDDGHCFMVRIHVMSTSQIKSLPCATYTSTYLSSSQLLYDVGEGRYFDPLFSNVEMPKDNGMNLVSVIGKLLPLALTVFATFRTKHATKAYELSVFHYISESELEICLPLIPSDVRGLLIRNSHNAYAIGSSRMMEKIVVDDILYIYKDQRYVVIVLEHEKILYRKSLNQVLGGLRASRRGGGFLTVGRGYTVSLFHVEKMESNGLSLDNGIVIPVSHRNQKGVRNTITSYWRRKL